MRMYLDELVDELVEVLPAGLASNAFAASLHRAAAAGAKPSPTRAEGAWTASASASDEDLGEPLVELLAQPHVAGHARDLAVPDDHLLAALRAEHRAIVSLAEGASTARPPSSTGFGLPKWWGRWWGEPESGRLASPERG